MSPQKLNQIGGLYYFLFFFLIGPNVSCPHWQQRNRRRLSIITLPTRPCLRNDNWNHGTSLFWPISGFLIIKLYHYVFLFTLGLYIASRFLIIIIQRILLNAENAHRQHRAAATFHKPPLCVCVILKIWSKNKISIYPPPAFLFSVN